MRTPRFDPGDPDMSEPPCEVCGKDCDDCICPECPSCGEYGNPKCYENHGLLMSVEQFRSRDAALAPQYDPFDGIVSYEDEFVDSYLSSIEYPWDLPDFL